jgi:ribonucleoside-diphosphate reductase beta chain
MYTGKLTEIVEDNLFHGILPKRIIVGMVETSAFQGNREKNPMKFDHFDIREIGLFVNGQSFPYPMVSMNFHSNKYDTAEIYHLFMDSLHAIDSPDPPLISKKDYDANGFTLFGFNLSADQYQTIDQRILLNLPANIRLQMKFNPATTIVVPMTLIIYYEMFSGLSINKHRQVTFHSK